MMRIIIMLSLGLSIIIFAPTFMDMLIPPPVNEEMNESTALMRDIIGAMQATAKVVGVFGFALIGFLFAFGGGSSTYSTDIEVTPELIERKSSEQDQLGKISEMVTENMNMQVVNVIDKCKKVHAGYQKYPNFKYERSAFYHSDLSMIHEFMTVYSETTELKKMDMDHMVNSMAKFENHLDDILNMQQESLLNKFRVALDVLKARSS